MHYKKKIIIILKNTYNQVIIYCKSSFVINNNYSINVKNDMIYLYLYIIYHLVLNMFVVLHL